ncbi:precorrin-4 c11-methyltransferase [Leptolyngbya sp. Heron Island J]|uniref:precorrin-4 C(11)-methyltransferase n=1 Tax=Leptolyngbya sp. Heron Island J TaxID=1385935 RepID=UPI0003B984F9|nr:precorrin-4 C(11)-methyltransferase [Leptolyngbya sp. Heron Island J]ESA38683.1 precorrin-4 c11-methyltransferase [Leptolyngbya sp. Heron Island J]
MSQPITPSSQFPPVHIIGAGPGAPDLITVRGQTLLAAADTVFYTGSLVPEQMLQWCRADVETIDTRSHTLETWLPLLQKRVSQGQRVVRLQDGDPCLYGALHELTTFLLKHQISFEIVPGVSAFQLAAARLEVELTVPQLVQSIILTRVQGRTDVPGEEDLASLASHQASLCLYLSARHAAAAQSKLMAHYPPDTSIALCYRLGWPDEEIRLGRLDAMATLTQAAGHDRTVMYLISPALAAQEARSQLYNPDHSHLFRPHVSKA